MLLSNNYGTYTLTIQHTYIYIYLIYIQYVDYVLVRNNPSFHSKQQNIQIDTNNTQNKFSFLAEKLFASVV